MKLFKINILIVLSSLILFSCSKTTKGKLSNEWVVSQYAVDYSNIGSDTISITTEGNRSSATTTTVENGQSSTSYLSITKNEVTIEKDGEWEQEISYHKTLIFPNYQGTSDSAKITTYYKYEIEGTWSFLKKNEAQSFKKNEVVVFYPTKVEGKTKTITRFQNDTTTTLDSFNTSFNNSSNVAGILLPSTNGMYNGVSHVWKVKSSSQKELVLTIDKQAQQSILGYGSSNFGANMEVTLEKK